MRCRFFSFSGMIEQPPKWFRRFYPAAAFRIETGSGIKNKKVYLSFDDGPIPEVTPHLLNILRRYDAKATFFMVGDNARKYPQLVKDIIAEGHSIGNHTMHHLQGMKTPNDLLLKDIEEASKYIPSVLFRPSHGILRRKQYLNIKKQYKIVMFDIVTRDYNPQRTPQQIVECVKQRIRNGSIIVMHDSLKSWTALQIALPELLQWLHQQGFETDVIPNKKSFN